MILKDFKIDFTFLNIVNNKNMLSRLRKRNKLNRYDKFSLNSNNANFKYTLVVPLDVINFIVSLLASLLILARTLKSIFGGKYCIL